MDASELLLVRHGESAGNVAARAADLADAETVDVDFRDADAPLSRLGREQAAALGTWLGRLPRQQRPAAVWSSPYLRARDTAAIALDAAGVELPVRLDERLRDRELGILDRLTGRGVRARHPDEAERRRLLGKLYYRPPGGESWADVALRLRSCLAELDTAPGGRTLVVAHDAVILLVRYVLEGLGEQELLELARTAAVGNASVTRLRRDAPGAPWRAVAHGCVEHLHERGVPPTRHGRDDAGGGTGAPPRTRNAEAEE